MRPPGIILDLPSGQGYSGVGESGEQTSLSAHLSWAQYALNDQRLPHSQRQRHHWGCPEDVLEDRSAAHTQKSGQSCASVKKNAFDT